MANKQIIISVGREYGSGGHYIAEKLSKKFGLPMYDLNLLESIAASKSVDLKNLEKYDEVPKSKFLSRRVLGYSNSPEENVANMQFDFLTKKATEGESFVVVGRCSEEILKGFDGLITIFILGDKEEKIKRIAKINNISEEAAKTQITYKDKKRKAYHNYYCKGKWGDSRNYDLSVNSSKLGLDATADMVEHYIRERVK